MIERLPVDHAKDSKRPTPQLGELADSALTLFHSKHTFVYHETFQGYDLGIAADDAVKQSGFSSHELYSGLSRQTSLTPEDIFQDAPSDESWEELELYVSGKIVQFELKRLHPEIENQNQLRLNWESKSYKAAHPEIYKK